MNQTTGMILVVDREDKLVTMLRTAPQLTDYLTAGAIREAVG
jgi:hypothetical protein